MNGCVLAGRQPAVIFFAHSESERFARLLAHAFDKLIRFPAVKVDIRHDGARLCVSFVQRCNTTTYTSVPAIFIGSEYPQYSKGPMDTSLDSVTMVLNSL